MAGGAPRQVDDPAEPLLAHEWHDVSGDPQDADELVLEGGEDELVSDVVEVLGHVPADLGGGVNDDIYTAPGIGHRADH